MEEASGKLRALAVINEKHVRKAEEELVDTAKVDMVTLRVILRLGVLKGMQIRSTEVSQAFLNTSLSEADREGGILCQAPRVFADAGVCAKGEVWCIQKKPVWTQAEPNGLGN